MRYVINADPRLGLETPYELLAAPEIIYFTGEINEESASEFRRAIEVTEHNALAAGQEILPVCIDSQGGCLYSLMGMIDAMESCTKAGRIKLATVIECKAMSAAVNLITCGDKNHRYMGELATIMLHSGHGTMQGSAEIMEGDLKELKRLDKISNELLSKQCGHKKDFFEKELKNHGPEWYITAKEAKKLGIISHIGIPILETTISYTHSLRLR